MQRQALKLIKLTITKIQNFYLYLFALCIIVLVNSLICNDPIYEPKSQRNCVRSWVTKYWHTIRPIITHKMQQIEIYVTHNYLNTSHQSRKRRKARRSSQWRRIRAMSCAYSALAMNAATTTHSNITNFDTDAVPVGIDNRCSACISHVPEDFIGTLEDTNRCIKGFGGSRTTGIKIGTLRWTWLDDAGLEHTFKIPNSYYVPSGKVRLLSPQHWAKHCGPKTRTNTRGTCSQTTSTDVTLYWNQRQSQLTVPLSHESNVATFFLAPGFSRYYSFCSEADVDNHHDLTCPLVCESTINESPPVYNKSNEWIASPRPTPFHDQILLKGMDNSEGESSHGAKTIDKEFTTLSKNPNSSHMAELLRLHQRLGHMPFAKLKQLAKQGSILSYLAKTPTPVCAACFSR